MSLNKLNQPLSRRAVAMTLGLLTVVGLVSLGSWSLWRHHQTRPLDTAGVRQAIRSYLQEQTGDRQFKPLAFDTSANSSSNGSDTLPDAAANSGKTPKLKKKSQPTELARGFTQQIQAAADYKTIYRVIGQGLALVDQSLATGNPADLECALELAAGATRAAHDNALNDWLAARIAEGYLWPGVPFAASKEARRVAPDFLLNIAEDAFRDAGETNNLVRNYRLLIAQAGKPGKADNIRFRLARLLEEQADFTGALAVLREVQDTNSNAFQKRFAIVERRANDKPTAR